MWHFPELSQFEPVNSLVSHQITEGDANITFVFNALHSKCNELGNYQHVFLFMPYPDESPKNQPVHYLSERFSKLAEGAHVGIYMSPTTYCGKLVEDIKPLLMSTNKYEVRFIQYRYGLTYDFEVTPPTVNELPPMFQVPIGQNVAEVIAKHVDQALEPVNMKRKYMCSFVGDPRLFIKPRANTVYLVESNPQWHCFLDTSVHWSTDKIEKNHTLAEMVAESYVHTTLNSDFSLCPAGGNVESYRIYESAELGSIPILTRNETRMTMYKHYQCTTTYPFLQEFNAPFVWLDSWDELPQVMEALMQETPEQIYQRRCVSVHDCWCVVSHTHAADQT